MGRVSRLYLATREKPACTLLPLRRCAREIEKSKVRAALVGKLIREWLASTLIAKHIGLFLPRVQYRPEINLIDSPHDPPLFHT